MPSMENERRAEHFGPRPEHDGPSPATQGGSGSAERKFEDLSAPSSGESLRRAELDKIGERQRHEHDARGTGASDHAKGGAKAETPASGLKGDAHG